MKYLCFLLTTFFLLCLTTAAFSYEYNIKKMKDGSFRVKSLSKGETKFFKFEVQKDGTVKAFDQKDGTVYTFTKQEVQEIITKYKNQLHFEG